MLSANGPSRAAMNLLDQLVGSRAAFRPSAYCLRRPEVDDANVIESWTGGSAGFAPSGIRFAYAPGWR